MNKYLISLLGLLLALTGCARKELKVMATTTPHAQMLNFVAPDLKAQRIDLTVIITDNYALPNEALANKDVDANFFQDGSFLATEVTRYGYPLVSLTAVEIEPMGFYSNKIKSIDKLADNATIAVADDPSNQARALILLQQKGLIEFNVAPQQLPGIMDIVKNPKHLRFLEFPADGLYRTLTHVDMAAINTNFAMEAGLSPTKDALVAEGKNSPYANVIAIRKDDVNRPELQALKTAMTSDKMRKFILDTYKGSVLPAF